MEGLKSGWRAVGPWTARLLSTRLDLGHSSLVSEVFISISIHYVKRKESPVLWARVTNCSWVYGDSWKAGSMPDEISYVIGGQVYKHTLHTSKYKQHDSACWPDIRAPFGRSSQALAPCIQEAPFYTFPRPCTSARL